MNEGQEPFAQHHHILMQNSSFQLCSSVYILQICTKFLCPCHLYIHWCISVQITPIQMLEKEVPEWKTLYAMKVCM